MNKCASSRTLRGPVSLLVLISIASLLNVGCAVNLERRSIAQSKSDGNENAEIPDNLSDRRANPLSDPLRGLPKADEAWRQFTSDGQYRLAGKSDFQFSNKTRATNDIWFLEQFAELPHLIGDFNDDGDSRDVAVIVVDTSQNDPERFGLVLFISPTDNDTIAQPNWVFKNKDLSHVALSRGRDGLGVRDFGEDGSYKMCHPKWDKTQGMYICTWPPYRICMDPGRSWVSTDSCS